MSNHREILASTAARQQRGDVVSPACTKNTYVSLLEASIGRLLAKTSLTQEMAALISDACYASYQLGTLNASAEEGRREMREASYGPTPLG